MCHLFSEEVLIRFPSFKKNGKSPSLLSEQKIKWNKIKCAVNVWLLNVCKFFLNEWKSEQKKLKNQKWNSEVLIPKKKMTVVVYLHFRRFSHRWWMYISSYLLASAHTIQSFWFGWVDHSHTVFVFLQKIKSSNGKWLFANTYIGNIAVRTKLKKLQAKNKQITNDLEKQKQGVKRRNESIHNVLLLEEWW